MPLPGVETTIGTDLPATGVQVDSGTAFVAGVSERGPVDRPVLLTSGRAVSRHLGGTVTYSDAKRNLERFFQRGGRSAYFARVVGPSAVAASVELDDTASGKAIEVTAVEPGDWGNDLTVTLTVAASSQLTVKLDGDVVEVSQAVADKDELIAWSERSEYVRVTDAGGGALKADADVALTGGTDDRNNITTDEWEAALELFDPGLGIGQVLAPGYASSAIHAAFAQHAVDNNRFALLDPTGTAKATVLSDIAAVTGTGNGRAAALLTPGVEDGGTIPGSILAAARIAYTDATAGPGQYAAGVRYGDIGAGSTTVNYTEEERDEINEAGGQVIRQFPTGPRIYGFRTLAGADSPWLLAAHSRVIMVLKAELEAVLENFVLRTVSGPSFFGELQGALSGPCERAWSNGDLYGETSEEAYKVQADEELNPPETLAQGELHAIVAVRPGPGVERIYLNLTKASVADTL
jgi:hypothetical protein